MTIKLGHPSQSLTIPHHPSVLVVLSWNRAFYPTTGKVVVDLYYEALCPDSRDFIFYQLFPAWQGLKDIFTINYIPYGKAYVSRNGVTH